MIEIKIDTNANDQRLDRFLHKHFDVPKHVVQKWCRTKKIKRNNLVLQASDRVYTGDLLTCYVHADLRKSTLPTKKVSSNLDILYEDEDILIMYKPPGMLSHAAHGQEYGKNLVDRMITYLIEKGDYVPRRNTTFTPAIINRLDRNTGGLVIGAKTYASLKDFNDKMRKGEIHKYYLALATEKKPQPKIYEGMWSKGGDRFNIDIKEKTDGVQTKTEIVDVEKIGPFYLTRIRLYTGKTHQIRSLFESLGHPILGDPKYENKKWNRWAKECGLHHQFLLANALVIENDQGEKGRTLHVKLPLPDRYEQILDRIRKETYED